MSTDRGQAHTLEAVAAGTILLAALVFASQAAAVTPLTASTSSQHIENQQMASVDGMLAGAEANETLKPAVLLVNNSTGQYYGTGADARYSNGGPPSPFGAALNRTWRDEGVAFNVDINYVQRSGGEQARAERSVVYMGEPTDSSVSSTVIVTLYDDDRLHEPGSPTATPTDVTLNETTWDDDGDGEDDDLFYASDVYDGPMFNVVEVEVTVWRM